MATPVGAATERHHAAHRAADRARRPAPSTGTVTSPPTASDDVGVAGVQFQLDGGGLGSRGHDARPTRVSWDTTTRAAGAHTLTAVARDAAGNRTTSAGVGVNVPGTPAPTFVNDRVIIGLDEPTALTFTPDGRMLIAERDGTIWVVQPGATPGRPHAVPAAAERRHRRRARAARPHARPAASPPTATSTSTTRTGPLRNRVSRFTACGNSAPPRAELVIWQNTDAGGHLAPGRRPALRA